MKAQIKTMKTLHFQPVIYSRRSQIKMFETIAILVIFFILITLGFIFYAGVQKTTFQVEKEETILLKAVEISEKISFLPELQCSRDNIPEEDCVDILKLAAAEKVIFSNKLHYFDILKNSKIYIEEIYPDYEDFEIYDFPKREDRGIILTQFPVSLYDPQDDTYAFGVMHISIYR